jgi:hypothetical protein
MNTKQLAEMIKHLRKMKMEQLGGMGKFKGGAVDVQDLSGPNRRVGTSSKEQHHVTETIGATHAAGLKKRVLIFSKMPSQRNLGGNQKRGPETYHTEAEQELGKTMTGNKTKKRTETINKEPKIDDHIF